MENFIEKLKEVKEERGITYDELSELSKIPKPTLTRIFSGQTANPTLETVVPIAVALGTSIDELVGLKKPEDPANKPMVVATLDAYAELLREKDERLRDIKDENAKVRKEKRTLAIALTAVVAFIMTLLTIDILNGNFGYFRY